MNEPEAPVRGQATSSWLLLRVRYHSCTSTRF